jgi:3-isopropylmalate dehydrogenase
VPLYEPVHGSAPDIAGQNIANPLGAIATAALLLRYTAKNEQAARDIETAIADVLAAGFRTRDLSHGGHRFTPKSFEVSTKEMGAHVRRALADVIDQKHTYHAV